jgi:hypothetical protein
MLSFAVTVAGMAMLDARAAITGPGTGWTVRASSTTSIAR